VKKTLLQESIQKFKNIIARTAKGNSLRRASQKLRKALGEGNWLYEETRAYSSRGGREKIFSEKGLETNPVPAKKLGKKSV